MRTFVLPALLLGLLALPAPIAAQNLVTNGDFSGGITGWTETGFSVSPGIETFDTTGLGADPCYACSPGGQVTPPPYPPNTLEQMVPVAAGLPYELTADMAVMRPLSLNNADAGTFYAQVNGVEIARIALGSYTNMETQRFRLCGRFTPTASGMLPLKIFFERTFLANSNTPRARIDNITLQIATGPTFCIRQNRKIGTTVTAVALGDQNAQFAMFLAPARTNGLQIPGIFGTLYLDPMTMVLFFGGTLDSSGLFSLSLPIPNNAFLTVVPLYVQGAMVSNGRIVLGFDQFLTFTQ